MYTFMHYTGGGGGGGGEGGENKLNISIYMQHFTDGSCVFMPNHSFLNSTDIYTKCGYSV